MAKKAFLFIIVLATTFSTNIFAQNATPSVDLIGKDSVRVITTAVPFLTISPDARSGAMGDVGAAISPDANSIHWNAAKLVFTEKDMGVSLSFTPWLRKLVNDMSISYLAGYKKLSKEEAVGISLLYFDLGSIQFTDQNGAIIQDFNPKEFAISGTYSRKLSDNLSIAAAGKFIHSNLSGGISNTLGTNAKAGNTAAVDLSAYYQKDLMISGINTNLAFGGAISNLGAKISYTNNNQRDFIPTNLRLGSAATFEIDAYNKFVFALDFNKLLVPTTPVYAKDTTGTYVIVRGKDPKDKSLLDGIFGSFSDAPDGFKEELREVTISMGGEYWYNDLLAVRAGYFNENRLKGNRKYFTLGFGVRYNKFGLDFAYLIPVYQNNPLAETLRFSLHFDFERRRREESITE